MSGPVHRVRRQILEVVGTGEDETRRLQRSLSALSSHQLEPILDRCFSEHAPSGTFQRVETLEVDLGTVDSEHLARNLLAALEPALRRVLAKIGPAAPEGGTSYPRADPSPSPGSEERSSTPEPAPLTPRDPEASLEVLELFLRSGRVPWWADAKDPELVSASVERSLATAPQRLRRLLDRMSCHGNTLFRLVKHCEDRQAATLFRLLNGSAGSRLEDRVRAWVRAAGGPTQRASVWSAVLTSACSQAPALVRASSSRHRFAGGAVPGSGANSLMESDEAVASGSEPETAGTVSDKAWEGGTPGFREPLLLGVLPSLDASSAPVARPISSGRGSSRQDLRKLFRHLESRLGAPSEKFSLDSLSQEAPVDCRSELTALLEALCRAADAGSGQSDSPLGRVGGSHGGAVSGADTFFRSLRSTASRLSDQGVPSALVLVLHAWIDRLAGSSNRGFTDFSKLPVGTGEAGLAFPMSPRALEVDTHFPTGLPTASRAAESLADAPLRSISEPQLRGSAPPVPVSETGTASGRPQGSESIGLDIVDPGRVGSETIDPGGVDPSRIDSEIVGSVSDGPESIDLGDVDSDCTDPADIDSEFPDEQELRAFLSFLSLWLGKESTGLPRDTAGSRTVFDLGRVGSAQRATLEHWARQLPLSLRQSLRQPLKEVSERVMGTAHDGRPSNILAQLLCLDEPGSFEDGDLRVPRKRPPGARALPRAVDPLPVEGHWAPRRRPLSSIPEIGGAPSPPRSALVDRRIDEEDTYYIENSGLVLLWPFLGQLFKNLELTAEGCFVEPAARHRAVGLLQHLVTGASDPPEYQVLLGKVLCGMDLDEVLDFGAEVSTEETEACRNLMLAAIDHAPILNDMSIDGLRGSFLLRQGVLRVDHGSWLLTVERASYDVVLDRLPWVFEWVKYPWMEAPLRVQW